MLKRVLLIVAVTLPFVLVSGTADTADAYWRYRRFGPRYIGPPVVVRQSYYPARYYGGYYAPYWGPRYYGGYYRPGVRVSFGW